MLKRHASDVTGMCLVGNCYVTCCAAAQVRAWRVYVPPLAGGGGGWRWR